MIPERVFNAEGNLVDWWTKTDLEQFTTLGKSLSKQLQCFTAI
ncbi:hypothetical protein QW060_27850 [Myroides ceti]|uniref:Uncharacterized protein n=1 Tax=Paenimyroides ceti TaxID=395087 RepID=A0ABT8D2Q1_9FLAO|nr:hypothetical protein [Paenimyroides ceti]MDN3710596.1 hypothetical protein [Paenimyroides ceti]